MKKILQRFHEAWQYLVEHSAFQHEDEGLRDKFSEYSDYVLLRTFLKQKDSYRKEALDCMEKELKKRGVPMNEEYLEKLKEDDYVEYLESLGKKELSLELKDDGFVYKDKFYSYDDTKSLYFFDLVTVRKVNFVKVEEPETVEFHIILNDDKTLKIKVDERSLFIGSSSDKTNVIKVLKSYYQIISRITFSNRLNHYLKQIEKKGYFIYDGCEFFPNDKIIAKGEEFKLQDVEFFLVNRDIQIRKKDKTFGEKIFSSDPCFETRVDTDVIFVLLEKLFNIRFVK